MNDIDSIAEIAIKHFGHQPQIIKALEECCELSSMLAKSMNEQHLQPSTFDKIIDEIADVTIMVRQLRLIYSSESVDYRIEYKLKRIMKRMGVE